jgi:hypothetical protein
MGTGSGCPYRILENMTCQPMPVPIFFDNPSGGQASEVSNLEKYAFATITRFI